MATKEFLTITAKAEKNLKASIIEQIKLIEREFTNLTKFPSKKDYKLIVDVYSFDDELSRLNDKAVDKSIENFMKAPLGKDLRRNVAYLMILRTLREISHDSVNIAKYINTIQGMQINKNWVYEISGKIQRRVELLLQVIEKEDIDLLAKLIIKDESVNDTYKNLLKKFNTAAQTKKQITRKEKDAAILGFIMALKAFERAGDGIKECGESIRFIITGKFHE